MKRIEELQILDKANQGIEELKIDKYQSEKEIDWKMRRKYFD